jgi:hypothetical protein
VLGYLTALAVAFLAVASMPRSVAAQTAPKVVRIGWLTAQQASSLTLFLVKQGYGVRDARDESAQAGEQQQFFDLPDHDVLPPRRSRRLQQRRGRTLGSTRGFSSKEEPAQGGRGNPHPCCDVVSNGCRNASAPRGAVLKMSAAPLPQPKPAGRVAADRDAHQRLDWQCQVLA